MYYWQKLISSIEWNGNTVEFEYAQGTADDLNLRLAGMTIRSSDGTVVKKVVFGNDIPWKSGTDKGRRVLSGLDDSVEGRYAFTYYTGNVLPNIIKSGNPSKYTDSWGYYNGGNGDVVSKDVAEWLRFDYNNNYHAEHTNWRDRTPKLEYARLGVLKTIRFPTGGQLTYEYELNERYGERHGGLRVASTSLYDGGNIMTRKYRYIDGVLPQMHPDSLSMHISYLRIENVYNQANPITLQYRTACTSPFYSAFSKSAPVLYTKVLEELSDGTYTIYDYDAFENSTDAFRQDWHHPSTYPEPLTDWGMNEPVLKEKRRYSASGTLLHRETNKYIHKEISSIETGVRLISVIDFYTYLGGDTGYEKHEDEFPDGVGNKELLVRQTTACQMVTALESTVTEDLTTGFSSTVRYTHDPQYRTLRPLTETIANSDGVDRVMCYEYPFHRTGDYYRSMMDYGYTDWVLSTSEYSGGSLIARKETEYEDPEEPEFGWVLPLECRSWSAPTASSIQSPPASLPERVRIGTYSFLGRPASITVNGTDLTTLSWTGDLLESMTAPGGLKTSYTHRPLIGLTSMTQPNGYQTKYTYNDAGMLTSVADGNGPMESYSYSIASHPSSFMTGDGNSITKTSFLNVIGPRTLKSRQYHDALVRPTVVAQGGVNTNGTYVYTALSYDALGRESQTTLTAVGKSEMSDMSISSAKTLSALTYSDQHAWSETAYDALNRPVKVTTPGDAWHSAGKAKTMEYITNAANSVRLYRAPMDRISLVEDGYYAAKTLQGVRTVDEDGNVVKKFIAGAGYTQYWYDRAGRMSFMQDPNLREQNLHRFFVYDRAGRLAIQGVSGSCNRNVTVNFADWSGKAGGFMQTGYTLTDASRIQQVTLETVNYYDDYTFAPILDKDLFKSGAQSGKGLQTGTVVYGSDGKKSIAAIYYDIKGNVIESRERTPSGTLRTTVNTYTYSGQPLKSTVTEGSVTTVTENTYHTASGLLTATDVTVNDVKQRVSAMEYDDLGRIASVTRGAATKSGGKVSYRYNLHGQTTEISGPGLTQNLFYADGPGNKLYNGSVSAMTWTMGTDTRVRGYKYSYNSYGWLTEAVYGEHANIGTNPNRYTERFLEFMPNGGVRRLQRHGLKADGVYGKVDNLHISYDGNRITTVLEDADPVTQNGSMDYPGGNREMVFGYNDWGALIKDESRGITDITYDRFGNPLRISYSDGSYTENVYSAAGEKLKATHATSLNGSITGKTTTEYHGNVIYRDGKVDMVLFPGGYATINGTTVTFHYYTQDYLGNNRAVINGSTGAVEQTVAYYPYGTVIADLGTPTKGQPYKFGGKEIITANGLNEYDFGARQYYPAVPGFTKPDQMAEKYYWLSPYLYCANNPTNIVDPSGMIWEDPEETERILSHVQIRIQSLQDQNKVLESSLANPDMSDKDKSLTNFLINENNQKITLLDNCVKTIGLMGEDKAHTYAFESTDSNQPHMVRQGENGIIYVQASSDSMALHEITHVGQSLEQGGLVFVGDALRNASTELGGAAKNETIAYRTQYSMDPFNMPIPTVSIKWINNKYIQHITNPLTGKPLYPYLQ